MNLEEFGELLRERSDKYLVVDDEDDFLIYEKTPGGPEYIGSIPRKYDMLLYDIEDYFKELGIEEDRRDEWTI